MTWVSCGHALSLLRTVLFQIPWPELFSCLSSLQDILFMGGRACKTFCYNKGSNTQISKCVTHFNSRGERHSAPHKGLEELDTVCFPGQEQESHSEAVMRPFLWPGLLMPLALSNFWFDGQVLITYEMVRLPGVLSVSRRRTVKGNYVQTKEVAEWAVEMGVSIIFNNLFTHSLLGIFQAYEVPHWWLRARNQQKLMERIRDGLVHGQYSLSLGTVVTTSEFTEVLDTGAELSACLTRKIPHLVKDKMHFSLEGEFLAWHGHGSCSKAPKITLKAQHSSLRQSRGMQTLCPSAQTGVSFTMKECKFCWTHPNKENSTIWKTR